MKTENKMEITNINEIKFYRINNDSNGNPRHIVHFLELIKLNDIPIIQAYENAVSISKEIGGKRYRGKDFGCGIVFSSYNLYVLEKKIKQINK